MKTFAAVTAVAVCLIVQTVEAATVTGTVAFAAARGAKPNPAETLVWLDAVGGARPRKPETAQMVTKSKVLVPHVLAVPVGSTVEFPNEDPILHNLFSVSPANPFDLGLYRKSTREEKFDKPGVVNVYCNVHPNMSAVVHVMQTPWFGFAESSGGFRLLDVPPGRYRLSAWNEQGGTASSEIVVSEDGVVKGETVLKLDSRKVRARQHLNKHGQPYARNPSNDY